MRRGRGKGKKQNASTREDRGSGEEEKIPAYRRRGRPQKLVKDESQEEEEEKDDDDTNGSVTSKEDVSENGGKKRKKQVESRESNVTEEGAKSSADDSVKSSSLSMGFRQIGSRRKNKPRRAAEAVVECNGV